MNCRHCSLELKLPFVDLGTAPPSNAYLVQEALAQPERYYPLQVMVCHNCWLVQTLDYASREELFAADYAYFSSYAVTWLQHAKSYVDSVVEKFSLSEASLVMELAANDGYLLQYVKTKKIPCYGVEPTASTALAAREKGIEIIEDFFGLELAKRLIVADKHADLVIANNVLAHVPNINDFIAGIRLVLKPGGVASFEFPHLLQLVKNFQFDTIYHEHYSYLSLSAVNTIFSANGLTLFDVEELTTHGGSLRAFAQLTSSGKHEVSASVKKMLDNECGAGITSSAYYKNFQGSINRIKNELLVFLIEASRNNVKVAAYGAAAKGNTLLNYAGIKPDLLSYVVDKNPAKQGRFLPGSRIAIVSEEHLREDQPDFVLILPWNIKDEIVEQLQYIREWGARFVVASPHLEILA
jgi:SAM-dependent methyltransferase